MKNYFKTKRLVKLLDMRKDQDTSENIHNSFSKGVELEGTPLAILFCAILIASVGLNLNSTAVIIGAMLISPLMNPIITIGYSISIYDDKLLKGAVNVFLIQVAIALTASTFYFILSPIDTATPELLARTEPSSFDMIIAFTGGIAGIIGASRIEKSNVIPGVAIATALMPPLCTVGFGVATGQPEIYKGALYLFTINVFFIIFATFLGCKIMKLKPAYRNVKKYDKLIKRAFILTSILMFIPLSISSYKISKETYNKEMLISELNTFISENRVLADDKQILFATYNKDDNTLRLDCIGEEISDYEKAGLLRNMRKIGLEETELIIVNDLEKTLIDHAQVEKVINIPKVNVIE